MVTFLATFLWLLLQVLTIAIIIRALLSWFPIDRSNPLIQVLDQITEPVLAPLRRIIPTIGMIDITPLVAILLLQLLQSIVARVASTPL
ncbi:MAG: YggT family protein [Chloroflexi bacterium]|jgi:YggT family protein|nr:YggT family protein [Chloroflexota bacterium]GIW10928.1 MAG: YggT family protein [Dehalococcoidia bacterium]